MPLLELASIENDLKHSFFPEPTTVVGWPEYPEKGLKIMDEYNNQSGQSSYGGSMGTGAGTAPMKEKIAEKATEIKEQVIEAGRKATDKIDQSRQSTASTLEKTASTLHSSGDRVAGTGHQAVDAVAGAAHSAAKGVQATADYVRSNDLKAMGEDVQALVKRYPAYSIAAAAILGFLIVRGMRNSD
jgi:ElaB/YqjD/DUF883 family membrane-anchored ribosome-binding protein